MSHFWKDLRGYWSVSRNKSLPGPVVAYLIPNQGGTRAIEGDGSQKAYRTQEEAAEVVLKKIKLIYH